MTETYPMAAELMEADMLLTLIEFGRRFYRSQANIARLEAWRENRRKGGEVE
jgi:hypothetical protein